MREYNNDLVLVIEDEPIMRKIAVKVLKNAGYEVITAEDGRKGIALFKKYQDDIILVLLDMVLPKMQGKDVFIEVSKIKPGVNVLLNTGFSKDKQVDELFNLGVKHFIEKPYSLENLTKAINKAINDR
jgi:DNA-binding NtrC family response regulator